MLHVDCFGDAVRMTQDAYEDKHNFYAYNPSFDKKC